MKFKDILKDILGATTVAAVVAGGTGCAINRSEAPSQEPTATATAAMTVTPEVSGAGGTSIITPVIETTAAEAELQAAQATITAQAVEISNLQTVPTATPTPTPKPVATPTAGVTEPPPVYVAVGGLNQRSGAGVDNPTTGDALACGRELQPNRVEQMVDGQLWIAVKNPDLKSNSNDPDGPVVWVAGGNYVSKDKPDCEVIKVSVDNRIPGVSIGEDGIPVVSQEVIEELNTLKQTNANAPTNASYIFLEGKDGYEVEVTPGDKESHHWSNLTLWLPEGSLPWGNREFYTIVGYQDPPSNRTSNRYFIDNRLKGSAWNYPQWSKGVSWRIELIAGDVAYHVSKREGDNADIAGVRLTKGEDGNYILLQVDSQGNSSPIMIGDKEWLAKPEELSDVDKLMVGIKGYVPMKYLVDIGMARIELE